MGFLGTCTTRLMSSFDWMVRQVENHEALVDAALGEIQRNRTRAAVALQRVQRDGKELRARCMKLDELIVQWEERAKASVATDEVRAKECLRRKNALIKERGKIEQEERTHRETEHQLRADIATIDERFTKLKQQRNLMRTREARASALQSLRGADSSVVGEIDTIFERWEDRIVGSESFVSRVQPSEDEFEEGFLTQEEEQALTAELESLKR
jgi:phage shock protein A